MIKFLVAVVCGAFLALMINVHMQSNKLTDATVKLTEKKETVQAQPKQDYRLDRVRVIKDTDKRISCFFDVVKQGFINCSLY